jgi:aminoglycoside phosphotransferase (APT) family kinase protein
MNTRMKDMVMDDTRQTERAFAWAEQVMAGKIIAKSQHERWRPQWFLDIATGASEPIRVVMRGFRNPGYASPNEDGARAMLKVEAAMLRYLQDIPVTVPKYHGYDEELGWMLMERMAGESELTEVPDVNVRFDIFKGYLEDLAVLHSQPLDRSRVPEGMFVPSSMAELTAKFFDDHLAYYRNQDARKQPEPLLEFGIQWLRHHPFKRERPMRLGLGDIGPNQFLFDGPKYKALLDYEYAMVADPLMEIGLMRSREMTYPIGRFGELLRHYGAYYEGLTGEPFDVEALQYWTIFGVVVWPLLMNPAIQKPDPLLTDQAFLYSWETHHRRCIAESLAEQYDITLDQPELPIDGETILTPLHELIINQFDAHYIPKVQAGADRSFASYSKAIAQTLARGDRFGAKLYGDTLEELSGLLDVRPDSVASGLRQLEAAVAQDYEKDFEKRVRFFHRFEIRKEYLYEPMQHATGCASRSPLSRLTPSR